MNLLKFRDLSALKYQVGLTQNSFKNFMLGRLSNKQRGQGPKKGEEEEEEFSLAGTIEGVDLNDPFDLKTTEEEQKIKQLDKDNELELKIWNAAVQANLWNAADGTMDIKKMVTQAKTISDLGKSKTTWKTLIRDMDTQKIYDTYYKSAYRIWFNAKETRLKWGLITESDWGTHLALLKARQLSNYYGDDKAEALKMMIHDAIQYKRNAKRKWKDLLNGSYNALIGSKSQNISDLRKELEVEDTDRIIKFLHTETDKMISLSLKGINEQLESGELQPIPEQSEEADIGDDIVDMTKLDKPAAQALPKPVAPAPEDVISFPEFLKKLKLSMADFDAIPTQEKRNELLAAYRAFQVGLKLAPVPSQGDEDEGDEDKGPKKSRRRKSKDEKSSKIAAKEEAKAKRDAARAYKERLLRFCAASEKTIKDLKKWPDDLKKAAKRVKDAPLNKKLLRELTAKYWRAQDQATTAVVDYEKYKPLYKRKNIPLTKLRERVHGINELYRLFPKKIKTGPKPWGKTPKLPPFMKPIPFVDQGDDDVPPPPPPFDDDGDVPFVPPPPSSSSLKYGPQIPEALKKRIEKLRKKALKKKHNKWKKRQALRDFYANAAEEAELKEALKEADLDKSIIKTIKKKLKEQKEKPKKYEDLTAEEVMEAIGYEPPNWYTMPGPGFLRATYEKMAKEGTLLKKGEKKKKEKEEKEEKKKEEKEEKKSKLRQKKFASESKKELALLGKKKEGKKEKDQKGSAITTGEFQKAIKAAQLKCRKRKLTNGSRKDLLLRNIKKRKL